jgi:hypothetical protein
MIIQYKCDNACYNDYGTKREQRVYDELLRDGISVEKIESIRADGICIGCTHIREQCQCAFSGSAHPTSEERYANIKQLLQKG